MKQLSGSNMPRYKMTLMILVWGGLNVAISDSTLSADSVSTAIPTTAVAPPTNDNLCNAISLSVNATCSGFIYTNVEATLEAGEGNGCSGGESYHSVWFNFTAPPSGSVTITSTPENPANIDRVLYEEGPSFDCSDLSTLSQVTCSDDNAEPNTLTACGLTPGNNYYIRIQMIPPADGNFCLEVADGPAPASATLSGDNTICSGTSSDLTLTIIGGDSPFTVVYNDGTSDITINNYTSGPITVSPTTTTTYTLVSTSNTCGSATPISGAPTITVNDGPQGASLGGGGTICSGQSVDIFFTIPNGTPPYTVVYSDGTTDFTVNNYASNDPIPVSPTVTTNYTPVSVTDANGCTGGLEGFADVIVNDGPQGASLGGGGTICSGQSVDIFFTIPNGTPPYTVVYSDGTTDFTVNNYASNDPIPVSPTVTTNYTPVSVTDANGCTGGLEGFADVIVNDGPQGASLGGGGTICSGQSVDIFFTIPNGTPPYTVVYSDGTTDFTVNNYASNDPIPVSPTVTTNYTPVSVIDANGCTGGLEGFADVIVNDGPQGASLGGGGTICSGQSVDIFFTIPNGTPPFTVVYSDGTTDFTVNNYASNDPIPVSPTVTTNYTPVSVTDANGCTGGLEGFADVIVNPLPSLVVNGTACSADLTTYSVDLTSDGDNITTTLGTVVPNGGTSYTITDVPAGSNVTITAEITASGCQTQQTVEAPACNCPVIDPPTSNGDQSICQGDAIPALSVSVGANQTADWYDVASGGTPLVSGTTAYTPSSAGVYYAEARDINNGCVSNTRTAVTLTINPLPSLVVSGTTCSIDLTTYSVDLTSDGDNITATLGTVVPNGGTSYTITDVPVGSNVTITAEITASGCQTQQTVEAPACNCPVIDPPTSEGDQSICQGDAIPALSVSVGANQTADWYDVASGGTPLVSGTTAYTPSSAGVYYAEARDINNNCVSSTRTAVTLTINPLPSLVVNGTACSADLTTYSVDLTSDGNAITASLGTVVSNGGDSYTITGVPAGSNVTITAEITASGCQTQQTVEAPACNCPVIDPPTSEGDQSICQGDAIPALSVSVGANQTADWYDVASGGTPLVSGTTSYTPSSAGVYYAEARDINNNCVSSTRTAVTLTINPLPSLVVNGTACSTDLTTYSVDLTSDGDNITTTLGTVVPNGGTSYTITDVPAGSNVTITAEITASGCQTQQTVEAPACNCPVIDPPTSEGDQSICEGDAIPALSVSVGANQTADWYDVASGGTPLVSGTTSYTPSSAGVYYAEARDINNNCVSSTRTAVTLTINPLPSLVVNGTACSADLATYSVDLTSNGNTITASLGTVVSNGGDSYTITGVPAGSNVTITAEITASGCQAQQTVEAPACNCPVIDPPISQGDQSICEGDAIPVLSVSVGANQTADWYDVASGGTPLVSGTTSYTPSSAGVYYAEARDINNGCVSSTRTAVTLTINPLPSLVVNGTACSADLATYSVDLTSDGDNITATLGTVVPNGGTSYTITDVPVGSNVTITAEITASGCQAQQTVEAPACNCPVIDPPTSEGDQSICEGDAIPALSVSVGANQTADWYDVASGGTPLVSGTTAYTPSSAGVYYAEARDINNNCVSSTRTAVTLTINPLPSLVVSGTTCSIDLATYSVDLTSNGDNITATLGTVVPNGGTSYTITDVPVGSNVTITSTFTATACQSQQTVEAPACNCPVIDPPTSEGDQSICQGDAIPALSVSVGANQTADWYDVASGGTPLVSGTTSYTPSSAGVYYAEARDINNNCVSSTRTAVTLTINPLPSLVVNGTACSTDLTTYSVDLTSDGDNITATLGTVVPNGGTSYTITDVPVGSNVTITAEITASGCQAQQTVEAPACNCPVIDPPISQGDQSICEGDAIPALSVSVGANQTADWYDVASGGTPLVSGTTSYTPSSAGVYYAEARDINNNCVSSTRTAVTLTINPLPSLVVSGTTCSIDLTTYSVDLTSDGDNITATLGTVVPNGGTSYTITDVPAGSNVTITAEITASGCQAQQTVEAPACNCPVIDPPISQGDQSICEGDAIPALSVSVGANQTADWYDVASGGTPLVSGTTSYTPSSAGVYYAEARDINNGCVSSTRTAVTLTINALPTVNITGALAFCEGGSTLLDAGVGFDTYLWSNGSDQQSLEVLDAGTYSVTVTDSNGCEGIDVVTVVVNNSPGNTNLEGGGSICIGESANLFFTIPSGTPPYTVVYTDGSTNFTVKNYTSGAPIPVSPIVDTDYSPISVTDANGCTGGLDGLVTVSVHEGPGTSFFGGRGAVCIGQSVDLFFTIPGGTVPFTVVYSDGSTNFTVTDYTSDEPIPVSPLETTSYNAVSVTDANGCSSSRILGFGFVSIRDGLGITSFEGGGTICLGESSNLFFDIPDGTAPYTVVYSDGNTDFTVENYTDGAPISVSPSVSTNYTPISVTDADGCSGDLDGFVTVVVNQGPGNSILGGGGEICEGEGSSLFFTIPGGTPPYTVVYNNGTSDFIINDYLSGATIPVSPSVTTSYSPISVTDANGCSGGLDGFVTVTLNELPNLIVNSATCSVDLNTYSVDISTNGDNINVSSGNLINNGASSYTIVDIPLGVNVIITAAITTSGCQVQQSVNSPDCNCPVIDPPISGPNVDICQGQNIPALTVSVGENQTADWYDQASGGTLLASGTTSYIPPDAGMYFAEARDVNSGCHSSVRTAITLSILPVPSPTITGDSQLCNGQSTATLNAGAGYLSYNWSTGQTTPVITVASGGIYSVTVTDGNGCTGSNEFSVIGNPPPILSITGDLEFCNGSSTVLDAGPGFLSYFWSNGSNQRTLEVFTTGNYSVTVTDVNGCTGTDMVTVAASNGLGNTSLEGGGDICPGESSSLFFTIPDGNFPFTVVYTDGNSNFTVNNYESGAPIPVSPAVTTSYSPVSVTDANGCTGGLDGFVTVTVNELPGIEVSSTACSPDLNSYSIDISTNADMVSSSLGIVTTLGDNAFRVTDIPIESNVTITAESSETGCQVQQVVNSPDCTCPTIAPPISGDNQAICLGAEIPALTVSVGDNQTADWYDAPSGGTLLASGNTSFTPAGAGVYYAEAREVSSSCISSIRTAMTLTINDGPGNASLEGGGEICPGESSSLFFTIPDGNFPFTVVYTDGNSNFTVSNYESGAPIPVSPAATTSYSPVSVTDANGCTGGLDGFVTVTVNELPGIEVSSTACSPDLNSYSIDISTNADMVSSSLGSVTTLGDNAFRVTDIPIESNVIITAESSETGCQVQQVVNSPDCTCPTIAPPISGDNQAICLGAEIPALTVSVDDNQTADWYDAPSGGTLLASGNTSFTPAGAGVYYAEAREVSGNCISNIRTAMTLTINDGPGNTSLEGGGDICPGESSSLFFSIPDGNFPFTVVYTDGNSNFTVSNYESGAPIPVSPAATTSYSPVSVTDANGCTGGLDGFVTVTVNELPGIEVSSTACSPDLNSYSIDISTNADMVSSSLGSVTTLGDNAFRVTDIPIESNVIITAESSETGCQVQQVVNSPDCTCPTIAPPISGDNQAICLGAEIPALTVSVGDNQTADWYDAPSGGTLLASGSTSFTPAGAGVYYAEAREVSSSCISNIRTAMTLTINDGPGNTSLEGGGEICPGESSSLFFTIPDGNFPLTVVYTDGNSNFTVSNYESGAPIPVSPAVTTSYSPVSVTDANGCTGGLDGIVTVTVNELPGIEVSSTACSPDLNSYSIDISTNADMVSSSLGSVTTVGDNAFRVTDIPIESNVIITAESSETGCQVQQVVNSPDCTCPTIAPPISGDNQAICLGAEIPALTVSVGDNQTADWYDAPTGGTLLAAGTTSYIPEGAGQFYVETRDLDDGCVSSVRSLITLTISSAPIHPVITGDMSFCAGNHTVLDAGEGYSTYLWNVGSEGQSIEVFEAGVYSVSVTDTNGCSGIANITVTEISPEVVVASIDSLCEGEDLLLQEIGGDAVSWSWSTPEGIVLSGQQIILNEVTEAATGTYEVRITDVSGCTNSVKTEVFVNPRPEINVSSNGPICKEEPLLLSENGGAATSWLWTTPSGLILPEQNPMLPFTTVEEGAYTLEIVDDHNCVNTDTLEISFTEGVAFESNLLVNQSACVGDTVHFIDISDPTVTISSFLWNFGDGTTSAERDPIHTYTQEGTYEVTLEAFDNACGNISVTKEVSIVSCRRQNVFDGSDFSYLNVFPNPSAGQFSLKVELLGKMDVLVQLYNQDGKLINRRFFNTASIEESYELLTSGVYYIRVTTAFSTKTAKVVIQK